jgi:hypothetical protein
MRTLNKALAAMNLAANATSEVIDVRHLALLAVAMIWTGTPTGTVKLQGSVDNINWFDLGTFSQALAGAAGSKLWEVVDVTVAYVRLSYASTSGTGSLTPKVNGKRRLTFQPKGATACLRAARST